MLLRSLWSSVDIDRLGAALGVLIALVVVGATGNGVSKVSAATIGTAPCAKYASPNGDDSSPGSKERPYATVQYLVDHLSAGKRGCLFGGTFVGNLRVGTEGVTVMSLPGERARLLGFVLIRSTANGVTLQDLDVDGHDVPNITMNVLGDHVTLLGLNVTNRNKPGTGYGGICLAAGSEFEQRPENTAVDLTIARSRIHDCGDDRHEHALYLESTRNAHIVDSYFYDNPGYGILFYPDAQGSLVEYDVIDGNGSDCVGNVTFSGERAGGEYDKPHGSSKNVIRKSLITNARCRYNVESYYPRGSLTPVGNDVRDSCVWNAPRGNFGYERTESGDIAYERHDNLDKDPLYVDRPNKDFRVRPESPCAGKGPREAPGCVVPRIVGLRLLLARKKLRRSGCLAGRIRYTRSLRVGRVLRQSPRAGATRRFGARVHLVVGRR
jgi:hypothetical protein